MIMRQDVLAMSRHKTPALACFLIVCMGLLLFWGLHAHAQSAEETSEILEIELLQRDIRYISGQLIKLRQQTTQTGKDQQELGKVLREEIDALESRQAELTHDLVVLKTSSQKQIEQLQSSQKKLRRALAITAAFLCLALGGLILLWRARPALPKNSPPTTPGRTAMPKGTPPAVEKVAASLPATLAQTLQPQAEPSRPIETAASETFESTLVEPPSVVVDVPDFPEISPAFSAAPWAAVVAADLQNTQLAMTEASQDFMREPRIQP